MGWKDAPVIEATSAGQPAWMSAPEVGEEKTIPKPSMGAVALNAIPKGVANLLNTPTSIENLARWGLSKIPGVPESYTTPKPNTPMQLGERIGLIDPAKNPQTPTQRIVDAAVQGGVGMAVSPAHSIPGFLKNIGTGVVSAGAGQTTTEATKSPLAGALVSMATPLLLRSTAKPDEQARNAARDATLKEGRAAGYRLPPSEVNPSFMQNRLESIGGKAAIKQEAVARNQAVTDQLARKDLGIPPNTPLTESVLTAAKREAGKAYEEAKKLRPTEGMEWFPRFHQKDLVEQMKQARADANNMRKSLLTKYDPSVQEQARSLERLADSIQDDIAALAKANGKEEVVKALAEARVKIAKLHDVENATSVVGEVSAPMVGAMLNKDKPLTGNLELIGRYQQAFPKFMGEGAKSPTPGVSAVEPLSMAGLGMGGAASAGHPAGWLAGGLPLVRGPVRSLMLSQPYQRFFASPDYGGLSGREKIIQSLLAGRTQAGIEQGAQP